MFHSNLIAARRLNEISLLTFTVRSLVCRALQKEKRKSRQTDNNTSTTSHGFYIFCVFYLCGFYEFFLAVGN